MSEIELLESHQVQLVVKAMENLYPTIESELNFENHFELVCAVILSAQATDRGVNRVTPDLFAAFPTPEAMMEAPVEEIQELISSIGLYRNKAKYLKKMARQLVEDFGGQVPHTRKELMTLAGVGRKTANVVLTNAFNIPAFAVDTHVERVSKKFYFVPEEATVRQVEDIMTSHLPADNWRQAHHSILLFGRYQCTARHHDHQECLNRIKTELPDNDLGLETFDLITRSVE